MTVIIRSFQMCMYEGEADFIELPAENGLVGIYEGHEPAIFLLKSDEIKIKRGGQNFVVPNKKSIAVVEENQVQIAEILDFSQ